MLGSFLDSEDPDLSELIRAVVKPDQYDYGALVLVSEQSSSKVVDVHRDGSRELRETTHLSDFRDMLPDCHRSDHTNYARWGCMYLEEMRNLPKDVE